MFCRCVLVSGSETSARVCQNALINSYKMLSEN
jgi:hypothetical protein